MGRVPQVLEDGARGPDRLVLPQEAETVQALHLEMLLKRFLALLGGEFPVLQVGGLGPVEGLEKHSPFGGGGMALGHEDFGGVEFRDLVGGHGKALGAGKLAGLEFPGRHVHHRQAQTVGGSRQGG